MPKDRIERDYSKERPNQIEELAGWAKKNTNYNNVSPREAIKFFDSDKENLAKDLEHVSKLYHEMVNWAQSKFTIGKYTAMEYANEVLLKKTEGIDIEKIRKQIEIESEFLINPPLSKTSKTTIIQNTISEILKETSEQEISQAKLVEKLVHSGKFKEEEAIESIEKAMKMGAITSSKPGYVTL